MDNKGFYDVRVTIEQSPLTSVFFIVGQRGVGKTYSCKKDCILNFCAYEKGFIYVRRWTTEITTGDMRTVFTDTEEDPEVKKALNKKYSGYYKVHILPKSGAFWTVGEDEDGTLTYLDLCGRITCISKAEQFKGGVYNSYNRILFDEFITERGYIAGDREPELFTKIIGTAGRAVNGDLRVYLCGNPDASIEACPYLYDLRLDYEHLQSNTTYYYDAKVSGKIYAQNKCFIKLANFQGDYLNMAVINMFNTAEADMSVSGEVKKNRYVHVDVDVLNDSFQPFYELIIETPIITATEYHKHVYMYYGELYGEPVAVCSGHRLKYDIPVLYCRYDLADFRPRRERQTYRLNIPTLPEFKRLRAIMSAVDSNKNLISNDDAVATLIEQIRLNS